MKIVVTGGRAFADKALVFATLDKIHAETPIALVAHGAASGADGLAWQWAIARHVPCKLFHADWKRYGKRAGPLRNIQMLDTVKPELVVAFFGGRGTQHCMLHATLKGIDVLRTWEEISDKSTGGAGDE